MKYFKTGVHKGEILSLPRSNLINEGLDLPFPPQENINYLEMKFLLRDVLIFFLSEIRTVTLSK